MKKYAALAMALLVVSIAQIAYSTNANAGGGPVDENEVGVGGFVTGMTPVSTNIVHVDVTCGTITINTTANPYDTNRYYAPFDKNDCPVGASITISASANGYSGSTSGQMAEGGLEIDVPVVTVQNVPEFEPALAAIALVLGGGILYAVRRT